MNNPYKNWDQVACHIRRQTIITCAFSNELIFAKVSSLAWHHVGDKIDRIIRDQVTDEVWDKIWNQSHIKWT